jgi:hypothetical protein
MTEDFARDMMLLLDLLNLAVDKGYSNPMDPDYQNYYQLNIERSELYRAAHELMTKVQELKTTFNDGNRRVMMGLWIAGFMDPMDPIGDANDVNELRHALNQGATLKDLTDKASDVGTDLITLLDRLKAPHLDYQDTAISGAYLEQKVRNVMNLHYVNDAMMLPDTDPSSFAWLRRRLESMLAFFKGGGGGQDIYWPSSYVSSSSSSSSSSSYP